MYSFSINIFTSPCNLKELNVVEDPDYYTALKKAITWIKEYKGSHMKKNMFVKQVNKVINPFPTRLKRNRRKSAAENTGLQVPSKINFKAPGSPVETRKTNEAISSLPLRILRTGNKFIKNLNI
jgi:hypothetical protein